MKLGFTIALSDAIGSSVISAQTPNGDASPSPHKVVVVTNNLPPATRIVQPTPRPELVTVPQVDPSTAGTVQRPRVVTDGTGVTTDASYDASPLIDINN